MADLLIFLEDAPLWPLALLSGICLVAGWWLGRAGRSRVLGKRSDTPNPGGRFVELDLFRESQKEKARLEKENEALTEFFSMMDDFAKKMGGLQDRARLLEHLRALVDRMFLPQQILIFLSRNGRPPFLFLACNKGLPKQCPVDLKIGIGEGKIGLVAQDGIARDNNQFIRAMKEGELRADAPNQSPLKIELCAPMVQEERRGDAVLRRVVGVLSIGGISRHYKKELNLLETMARLGSVALTNQQYVAERGRTADSDGLTGLFNKRFLQKQLGMEIHAAENDRRALSIFLFDLDRFKNLNDTYGHLVGDEVLKKTARLLREITSQWPGNVQPARWGGEEFLVILPGMDKEEAWKRAEQVREELSQMAFKGEYEQPLPPVTLSGGIATFPEDGKQQSELVRRADEALYLAKKAGRNRILRAKTRFFSEVAENVPYQTESGSVA